MSKAKRFLKLLQWPFQFLIISIFFFRDNSHLALLVNLIQKQFQIQALDDTCVDHHVATSYCTYQM